MSFHESLLLSCSLLVLTDGFVFRLRSCMDMVRLAFDAPRLAKASMPPVVALALQGLANKDPDVRWRAAMQLESLGPRGAPAIPALIEALAEPVELVRTGPEFALVAMGPLSIPPLVNAARDKRPEVRAGVAAVLGQLGRSKDFRFAYSRGRSPQWTRWRGRAR